MSYLLKTPDRAIVEKIIESNKDVSLIKKNAISLLVALKVRWALKYAANFGTTYDRAVAEAFDKGERLPSYAQNMRPVIGLTGNEISRLCAQHFGGSEAKQTGHKQATALVRLGVVRRLPERCKNKKRPCTVSPKNSLSHVIFLPEQVSDQDYYEWQREDAVEIENSRYEEGAKSSRWIEVARKLETKSAQVDTIKELFKAGSNGRVSEIYSKYATQLGGGFVKQVAIQRMFDVVHKIFEGQDSKAVISAYCDALDVHLGVLLKDKIEAEERRRRLETQGTSLTDV